MTPRYYGYGFIIIVALILILLLTHVIHFTAAAG